MRVSLRTEYALRALQVLGSPGSDRTMKTSEIAAQAQVPEKYLEAILVDLRKAGLLRSRRGPDGGHALAKPTSAITVTEVLETIDGPLALGSERKPRPSGPEDDMEAIVRELWREVGVAIRKSLDQVTIAELVLRVESRRGVLDFDI
ncbi:MAG: RrF2 family transcriptional regulator [Myxococcota bacterium]|jgi:Rrf2 family protein